MGHLRIITGQLLALTTQDLKYIPLLVNVGEILLIQHVV